MLTVTEQHFQRRYASTKLQCIEWLALENNERMALAGNDTCHYHTIENLSKYPKMKNMYWNALTVWYLTNYWWY